MAQERRENFPLFHTFLLVTVVMLRKERVAPDEALSFCNI
jgi:hypothetical protein